jgi:hypothetical protein
MATIVPELVDRAVQSNGLIAIPMEILLATGPPFLDISVEGQESRVEFIRVDILRINLRAPSTFIAGMGGSSFDHRCPMPAFIPNNYAKLH